MRNGMKSLMKKGMIVLLAGLMLTGLTACGKGGGSDETQTKKEFYYLPEYKNLQIDVNYVNNVLAQGDTLFLIGSSWDEEKGQESSKMYRYELLSDTCKEMILPLPENASVQRAVVDSEGNLLMIVNRYEQITGEAAAESETEKGGSEDASEADDGTAETSETAETAGATESVVVAETTATAMIGGTEEAAQESYEDVEYQSYIELWRVSGQDGTVIKQTDIKPLFDDPDNAYVQNMVMTQNDTICFSDSNANICLLDKDGSKLEKIETGLDWIDALFATKEGDVYLKCWGESGQEIRQVNVDSKTLGDAIKSENMQGAGYNQSYYEGFDKGVLISDSNSVFAYDFENDTKEVLFDWLDADLNSDDVEAVGAMSDGRFFAILHEYTDSKTNYSLVLLKKTPASEVPAKEEIMFGALWLDQDMRKNIIDFNKSSNAYHISVKTYGTDDYYAGLTQFNNDVASGNGPDIVDISNLDYSQYASKGLFEDLNPYLERDGIKREDYLENIFRAYEMDGKLYAVVPQFYITTTAAKASKVGDVTGWTLSEMLDFVEKSNAENVFNYGSRDSVFYYCIYNNIDEFIDWETGECMFNGEDFIRVLTFASQFPEEVDYSEEQEGISKLLRSDKVLLMQTGLSSVQEYQMYNGLFGEKVSYIGYPNSERKGNLIQPTGGSVALNAKSKHKDGAWEFIKKLLSEEYQQGLVTGHGGWGFPVKKSALDKQFELDMTPDYYEDENGEKVEQAKTSWGYDDFSMEIYAATQEEIDAVRTIIESAEKTAGSVNEELTNIITEETAPFFKGQKTAQETADIIQNRIQIYVRENS